MDGTTSARQDQGLDIFLLVSPAGIEPATHSLEGCCSVQLSYGEKGRSTKWSGREDSNLRPPAPKAGALPDCATPRQTCGKQPLNTSTRRQDSVARVVSAGIGKRSPGRAD